MNQRCSMRAYKKCDEDEIFELTKAVWEEQVPEKERWIKGWKWIHIDNPAGTSIIWLAENGSKIVSKYPVILENMKICDKVLKGAQLIDTMTHPQYRRQGICSALGKKALNETINKDIKLAYCFPTPQVYPLHMKSGWLDVCALQVMIKPLNLKNLIEKYITNKKLPHSILMFVGKLITKVAFRTTKFTEKNGVKISKISYFDDRFDDFWDKIKDDYNIIVVRDKRYLNWRYIDAPNAKYTIYAAEKGKEICGYIVLETAHSNGIMFGYIRDIIAYSNQSDILHSLISKGEQYFEEEKVDVIFSQMVPNKIYRKALFKNGFIHYFRSKSRFLAYNASGFSLDVLKNPENWFIQIGDLPSVY